METGIITSSFGERISPLTGKSEFHNGIDIAAAEGTAVAAVSDGRITETGSSNSYGNYLKYDVGDGMEIMYAHLKCIDVSQGDFALQGEKIAEAGSTGNATGPHLHYTIYRNGSEIDPMEYVDYEVTDEVRAEYNARGQAFE